MLDYVVGLAKLKYFVHLKLFFILSFRVSVNVAVDALVGHGIFTS